MASARHLLLRRPAAPELIASWGAATVERTLGSLFNRRVGLLGSLLIVGIGFALIVVIAQFLPSKGDDKETASATPPASASSVPTACQELDPPYGDPPNEFTYEPVAESKRAQTVKALRLDEAEGKVDVRDIRQTTSGINLGSLVGVPSKDPANYASRLVASAQVGDSKVERGNGYAILPLNSGAQVAVGVKGCRTVLISAQDPSAIKFVAAVLFSD